MRKLRKSSHKKYKLKKNVTLRMRIKEYSKKTTSRYKNKMAKAK